MAIDAVTHHLAMIQRRYIGQPAVRRRAMADFAQISRRWMVCGFACGYRIIVAARAGANDFVVINKKGLSPACREFLMAGIAGIAAVNMTRMLA